jgi:hypothetical protein
MENAVIFYDHMEYFTAIWYNFGLLVYIVCGHLVYFLCLGMFGPRKIWQPCLRRATCLSFLFYLLLPSFIPARNTQ